MVTDYSLQELADLVGGQIQGAADLRIHGLNGMEQAQEGEITFLLDNKKIALLQGSRASACIVPLTCDPALLSMPALLVKNPALAAAFIHSRLLHQDFVATGIHPTAVIGKDCRIPEQVSIGPLVCLGDRVCLGERVRIESGAVIGSDCVIGNDAIIRANVTVAQSCTIGSRVILQHGAVIGSDGFGFATDEKGQHHRRPQVGTVVIEDDVEIGANSCVDRATYGVTHICRGAKIDNLVMIGHNVKVGEHAILCGQVGIAGSTTLGRNVVLGAKAGVADHLHLADRVSVAAMSGVHSNPQEGAVIGGYPAFDAKGWARSTAIYARLPEMHRKLRQLQQELAELHQHISKLEQTDKKT